MKELYNEIEQNGLNIECWYRGLKRYSIQKLTIDDYFIVIKMSNDDSIVVEEKEGYYSVLVNKKLKYKNKKLDYSWLKEIYCEYLKSKGIRFI